MGKNLTPYVFAVGSRYTYFISKHYKFIENDKIEEGTLLNSLNDSLDPYDYHLSKNELDCFDKLLQCNRIHSSWPGMECGSVEEIVKDKEDDQKDINIQEIEKTDGSKEVCKNFKSKKCYML